MSGHLVIDPELSIAWIKCLPSVTPVQLGKFHSSLMSLGYTRGVHEPGHGVIRPVSLLVLHHVCNYDVYIRLVVIDVK